MPDLRTHPSLPIARIKQVSRDPAFLVVMQKFYRTLDQRIADNLPVCSNRGLCCKFGSYGHRLYVTSLELAYFIACHEPALRKPNDSGDRTGLPVLIANPDSCPYQQNGLCAARIGRPVGCRVFFCQSEQDSWPGQLTEDALKELKALHEQFDMPYFYQEWLSALESITHHQMAITPDLNPVKK